MKPCGTPWTGQMVAVYQVMKNDPSHMNICNEYVLNRYHLFSLVLKCFIQNKTTKNVSTENKYSSCKELIT